MLDFCATRSGRGAHAGVANSRSTSSSALQQFQRETVAPQREECEHLIQHAVSVPEVAVHVADGCTHLKRLYQQASGMLTRGDAGLLQSVQQQLLFAQLSLYRLGLRRLGRLGGGRRLPQTNDTMLAAFVGDAASLLRGVQPELLRSPFPAYLALHCKTLAREQPHLSATVQRCAQLQGVVADLLPPAVLQASALHTLVRLLEAYGQAQDPNAMKVLSHLSFELGRRAEAEVQRQYRDMHATRFTNLKWSGVTAADAQDSSDNQSPTQSSPSNATLQLPQHAESLVVTLHGLATRAHANHPGVRSCLHLLHCAQAHDTSLLHHLRAQLLAMLAVSTSAARLPRYALCHAFHGMVQAATSRDAFQAMSAAVQVEADFDTRPASSYLPLFLKAVTEAGVISPALTHHVAKGLLQGRPLAVAASSRWHPSGIMHTLQFFAGQGVALADLRCAKDAALRSRGGSRGGRGGKALDGGNMNPLIPLLEGLKRRQDDLRGDTAINCLYSIACLAPAERQVFTTLAPGLSLLTEVCTRHLQDMKHASEGMVEQVVMFCCKAVFSARVLGAFWPSSGARVHWQEPVISSASGQRDPHTSLATQLVTVQGDGNSHVLPTVVQDGRQGALGPDLAALARCAHDLLRLQASKGGDGLHPSVDDLPQVFLPRLHSVYDVNAAPEGISDVPSHPPGAAGTVPAMPRQDDAMLSDVMSMLPEVAPPGCHLLTLPVVCNLGVQPDALLLPSSGCPGKPLAILVQSWKHCRPVPAETGAQKALLLPHAAAVQAGWVDSILPGCVPNESAAAEAALAAHSRMERTIQLLQAHGVQCAVVTALQWRKWGNDKQRRNMLTQLLSKGTP